MEEGLAVFAVHRRRTNTIKIPKYEYDQVQAERQLSLIQTFSGSIIILCSPYSRLKFIQ